MNAKNGFIRVLIACGIVAVVLQVVLFAVPFDHGKVFWLSYAFVWVAIAVLMGVSYYIYASHRSGNAALYRTSMFAVSLVYLIAAFAASFIFMAIGSMPLWIATVVHVLLLAGCLLLLLGGDSGAKLVENDEGRTRAETIFVQSMRTQVSSLLAYAPDDDSKRVLEELLETLRFSDPVSNVNTTFVEQQAVDYMTQLNSAVSAKDSKQVQELCLLVRQALEQRNAIVRQTK